MLSIPVETYDERLTTRMADASRRGGAGAARDSLAAAHLLESYLASQAAKRRATMSDDWLRDDPFADPDDPAAREREQRRREREEKRRQQAAKQAEAEQKRPRLRLRRRPSRRAAAHARAGVLGRGAGRAARRAGAGGPGRHRSPTSTTTVDPEMAGAARSGRRPATVGGDRAPGLLGRDRAATRSGLRARSPPLFVLWFLFALFQPFHGDGCGRGRR